MKTSVEIPDALFEKAKTIAVREKTTMRALIEDGLRRVIDERRQKSGSFQLRDAGFEGEGLQAEVGEGSWERIREMIYEGRGG